MFKHKSFGWSNEYNELEIEYDSNIKFEVDMGKLNEPSQELLELLEVTIECIERTTDSLYHGQASDKYCEIMNELIGDKLEALLEYREIRGVKL